MNHLLSGFLADTALGGAPQPVDRISHARTAIEEILAEAYEAGDWNAVRTLHAVSALLAAVRH